MRCFPVLDRPYNVKVGTNDVHYTEGRLIFVFFRTDSTAAFYKIFLVII